MDSDSRPCVDPGKALLCDMLSQQYFHVVASQVALHTTIVAIGRYNFGFEDRAAEKRPLPPPFPHRVAYSRYNQKAQLKSLHKFANVQTTKNALSVLQAQSALLKYDS